MKFIKNIRQMKYSLKSKLSLSYVLFTIIVVMLLIFFTNFVMEKQFKDYVIKQQVQRNKEVVTLVEQQYLADGKWNNSIVENIGVGALGQGIIMKLRDNAGNSVWNATVHNNGMCTNIISQMSANMSSRYPNFKGGYVEDTYPITKDGAQIGTVNIGYYGPYYFTDNDLYFINTLNQILIGIGLLTIVFALILGSYMSKRLSNPISMAINAARKIARGDYSERISENSSTKEMIQLTGTINSLAETLSNQEKLRKRLTGDVAHELRTPMATLQSHMEAMIDGVWKPDKKRLTSCHEEILRLNRMVGNLEKLAKYESENLILNRTEFDIYELIENIINNFESDYRISNIDISLEGAATLMLADKDKLSAEKVNIRADKDKLSQVFVNLLSNSLKYIPNGGSVKVTVLETDSTTDRTANGTLNKTVKITVKDTGNGISKEDLPYIFERFYRADKSRNRDTGGSGIGLTIVKSIVDAHKGEITVESEPNEGTEFVITLPR